ncbi:MAG: type I glutamate--ammonia ligase [Gemmataceae bacterium]
MIREQEVKAVDLRFMDFPGMSQHFTIPASTLQEDVFEEGLGFDGSSIRGWKAINESDMLVVPVAETAFIDPFTPEAQSTLTMICNIHDPLTREPYTKDPRNVAQKAVNFMKNSGIADTAFFGPELEFFVFDDVRYNQTPNQGYYYVDSQEGAWNTGREEEGGNLGYKLRYKEGYFPVPPSDSLHHIRTEMMLTMIQCNLEIETHHHEVATGGQGEIDMRFDTLLEMADKVVKYKYIVKNVARKYGKTATFMPKPIFSDNGSGMHVHSSLWKDNKNLFYSSGAAYANFSDIGRYAIGGLLRHAPAVCAFTNPTTNSYKRLVPGFEAPVNLAFSRRNRSASVPIPVYSQSEKSTRMEFRCPDPSCNPYLAFSAMLMAMVDGIKNKIDPGQPLDKDIYDLTPEELEGVPKTPASLDEALDALATDKEFLLQGDVFTSDVIDTWIWYKRSQEADQVRLRPHPYEFMMYFDI